MQDNCECIWRPARLAGGSLQGLDCDMTARSHKWAKNLGSGLQDLMTARPQKCGFPDGKMDDCKIDDCKIWDCKTIASTFGGLQDWLWDDGKVWIVS